MSETKNPNYFVLVNEDNRLPNGFEDTVELIPSENVAGNQFQIEKKTYDAFCALREDVLKNDGIQTVLLGSYRTIEQQEKIFKSNLEKFGLDYAKNMLQNRAILSIIPALQLMWESCWRVSSTAQRRSF